jgi:ATP-dependent Lon protease
MTKPTRIPLFPLDVVLFPGTPLPLHIFEPRYKTMIRRCLDEQIEFGLVLARQDGIAATGCTAEVAEVVKQYPDGRMDILTFGRSVFHIAEVYEDQPYLEGQVEYLEGDSTPAETSTQQQLQALFNRCTELLFGREAHRLDLEAEIPLSYQIACVLPIDLEHKQELLETLSEADRQTHLLAHLTKWVPQLARMEQVRKKAGGNGHGLGGQH